MTKHGSSLAEYTPMVFSPFLETGVGKGRVKWKRPLRKKDLPNVSGIHCGFFLPVWDMLGLIDREITFIVSSTDAWPRIRCMCWLQSARHAHLAPVVGCGQIQFNGTRVRVQSNGWVCVTIYTRGVVNRLVRHFGAWSALDWAGDRPL